jgi:regulator of protease activity HflC (stomatin/prohibitin superfamily)
MSSLKVLTIVRPNTCKLVERFGRFTRKLDPGLHFLLPVFETVSNEISFKEETKSIIRQGVITRDSIDIKIDGLIYFKVFDAYKVTYSNVDAYWATEIMAQSLLRCEIGKLTLDAILQERQKLNAHLQEEMGNVADRWGIECFRYEITNINIDENFAKFMNYEAESERQRRKLQLDAQSIEVTAINNAQKDRAVFLNQKTAEGNQHYFNYQVIQHRARVLAELLEKNEIDLHELQLKLKRDLIAAFAELSAGEKTILMRKDLGDVNKILKDLF